MLIAGDVYRPAAIDQLVILGEQVICSFLQAARACFPQIFQDTVSFCKVLTSRNADDLPPLTLWFSLEVIRQRISNSSDGII